MKGDTKKNGVAESGANVGVVRATGDPADEVRATLANLTARARQLVLDDTDLRVVRNGRSLYETSKKAAEDMRQHLRQSSTLAGDGYGAAHPSASQASVELFMAKQLGFDMQEQQRLLQQLQSAQVQMAADLSASEPAALGGLGTHYSPSEAGVCGEVDAVVARLKDDLILQAQSAVHQCEKNQMRDQEYAIFKAAWSHYYVGVADDMEGLALRRSGGAGEGGAIGAASDGGSSGPAADNARSSSTGLVNLLASASPAAMAIHHKVSAFSTAVDLYAPSQWLSQFTSFVTEQALRAGDEVAVLWATTEQVLEPVMRRGTAATAMSYVASSRHVMERKALSRLLTNRMRIDSARFEEVAGMSTTRVLDIVVSATGTSNAWMHVFIAMRSGRYDVAVLAAQVVGSTALSAALQRCADASPMERSTMGPGTDLQSLYVEAATREDSFRQAVLFLLLAGRTGESAEAATQTLLGLSSKVASSLEDALWLRLACVRRVEEEESGRGGGGSKVQSLSFMQKAIIEDLRDLVMVTHGNVPRLASFLIHALLPCTGLRLLLENDATYVDGIHLALCFNCCDLLQSSALESPLDLARQLSRYSAIVLLDGGRRGAQQDGFLPGCATFSYFHKTGFDGAFVEFCQSESVCARLLGQYRGGEALLLRGSQPVSEDLMKAISSVAELAAARNNAPMAIHVLLVLVQAARSASKGDTARVALRRAVHASCPAAVQALYMPPHSNHVAALFSQLTQLRVALRSNVDTRGLLSRLDTETFEVLCTMGDVYTASAAGDAEQCLSHFFMLPFVPTSAVGSEVERCVRLYCESSSHYVVAAGKVVIPVALRAAAALMHAYSAEQSHDYSAAAATQRAMNLRQRMQTVCGWVKQCCSQPGPAYGECPNEVMAFE